MRRTFQKFFPNGFERRYGGKVTLADKPTDRQPSRDEILRWTSSLDREKSELSTQIENLGVEKLYPTGYEANYSGKPTTIEQFEAKARGNGSIGKNGQCLQELDKDEGFEKKAVGRITTYGKSAKSIDPTLLQAPVYSVPEKLLDNSKNIYEAKYPDMPMNDIMTLATSHATNRWLVQNTDYFSVEVSDWYSLVEDFHQLISSPAQYQIIKEGYPSSDFPPFTLGFPLGLRYDLEDYIEEELSTGHHYASVATESLLYAVEHRNLVARESTDLLQQELKTTCQNIFRIYTIVTVVCWPAIVALNYVDQFKDSFRDFYFYQETFGLVNSKLDKQVYSQPEVKSKINLDKLDEEFNKRYRMHISGVMIEPSRMAYAEFIKRFIVTIEIDDIVFYKSRSLEFRQQMLVLTLMTICEVDTSSYKLETSEIFFGEGQFYVVKQKIKENFGLHVTNISPKHKKRVFRHFNRHYHRRLWKQIFIRMRAVNYFLRIPKDLKEMRAAKIIQRNARKFLCSPYVVSNSRDRKAACTIQKLFSDSDGI